MAICSKHAKERGIEGFQTMYDGCGCRVDGCTMVCRAYSKDGRLCFRWVDENGDYTKK